MEKWNAHILASRSTLSHRVNPLKKTGKQQLGEGRLDLILWTLLCGSFLYRRIQAEKKFPNFL